MLSFMRALLRPARDTPIQRFYDSELFDRNVLKIIKSMAFYPSPSDGGVCSFDVTEHTDKGVSIWGHLARRKIIMSYDFYYEELHIEVTFSGFLGGYSCSYIFPSKNCIGYHYRVQTFVRQQLKLPMFGNPFKFANSVIRHYVEKSRVIKID